MTYKKSMCFGEQALTKNIPRQASIFCKVQLFYYNLKFFIKEMFK